MASFLSRLSSSFTFVLFDAKPLVFYLFLCANAYMLVSSCVFPVYQSLANMTCYLIWPELILFCRLLVVIWGG